MVGRLKKFNDYKLVHNFMCPNEPLKGWINSFNFSNIFDLDWNEFIPFYTKLIKECRTLAECSIYEDMVDEVHAIEDAFGSNDIATAFGNAVDILKYYDNIKEN